MEFTISRHSYGGYTIRFEGGFESGHAPVWAGTLEEAWRRALKIAHNIDTPEGVSAIPPMR